MKDGFIRVAAVTPKTVIADVTHNIREIETFISSAASKQCGIAVFPELCITASTCGDLFYQQLLLQGAEQGLYELMYRTRELDILCVVGLPVAYYGQLYNCAAVFHKGHLLGLVAKGYIPTISESCEARYFTAGVPVFANMEFSGQKTRLSTNLRFVCENIPELSIGVKFYDELCTATKSEEAGVGSSAAVIACLSSSNELIGRADFRRDTVKMCAAQTLAGYIHANSGQGESTTDLVFSGHNLIVENGDILQESELFSTGIIVADMDLGRIGQERLRQNIATKSQGGSVLDIGFSYDKKTIEKFEVARMFYSYPFVPQNTEKRAQRCELILSMQAVGLATRLRHIGCGIAIIGVSGGLDSTLALLATVRAFDTLNLPRDGIHAVSMPCFGTTLRTRKNAVEIAESLGIQFSEISIEQAVLRHFSDIGQSVDNHDVTYENAQARERTQVLMDLANQYGGVVVGTGDLSELALGWATYNGDHMSMYGINASIPKTLVRYIVRHVADNSKGSICKVLYDVLDTPVSPELLPPEDGIIAQKTEEIVGPYALHDFFLYYMLRFGFTPGKIFRMACWSFDGEYTHDTIRKWLAVFYRRFFSQQFKRSCLPDGPKIGTVGLSPRGEFKMPSDASVALWLKEIEEL